MIHLSNLIESTLQAQSMIHLSNLIDSDDDYGNLDDCELQSKYDYWWSHIHLNSATKWIIGHYYEWKTTCTHFQNSCDCPDDIFELQHMFEALPQICKSTRVTNCFIDIDSIHIVHYVGVTFCLSVLLLEKMWSYLRYLWQLTVNSYTIIYKVISKGKTKRPLQGTRKQYFLPRRFYKEAWHRWDCTGFELILIHCSFDCNYHYCITWVHTC